MFARVMGSDLDDAIRPRAPPVPIEAIRRVVASVLKSVDGPEWQKVEAHLSRNGMSLYDGRTAFFDALVAVFPHGKPVTVSRAAFATSSDAKKAVMWLSWAATCERWCSAYAELHQLMTQSSAFAKMRAKDLVGQWAATNDAAAAPAIKLTTFDALKGAANDGAAAAIAEAIKPSGMPEPLIAATLQVLFFRPTVWHRDVYPATTFADPVPLEFDNTDADWKAVLYEFKGKLDGAQVFVDGVSMLPSKVFLSAVAQLVQEATDMFPSNEPKYRRGACPTGTEYVVKVGKQVVPRGALDVAIRAALRKYGKIENVDVVCEALPHEFDAIPVDGSAVW